MTDMVMHHGGYSQQTGSILTCTDRSECSNLHCSCWFEVFVFPLLKCVTCTGRQGRSSWCLHSIATHSSTESLMQILCFKKTDCDYEQGLTHYSIFQRSEQSRGFWSTLQWHGDGNRADLRTHGCICYRLGQKLRLSVCLQRARCSRAAPPLLPARRGGATTAGCGLRRAHAFDRWRGRRRRRRLLRPCFPEERVWNVGHTSGQQLIVLRIIERGGPCAADVVPSAGVCA